MNILQELRKAGNDAREDFGDDIPDEVAYELANCLLEDPKILKAAKQMWPGKSRDILQEIVADYI